MTTESILERSDYEDFLVRWIFGPAPGLMTCIQTAYLDFNRTLHGMGKLKSREELYEQATRALEQAFMDLGSDTHVDDQARFDQWHELTCRRLAALFGSHGQKLYIGQAQKWINMPFKYVFTLGEKRVPGFGRVYPFCHVPLDNILIGRLCTGEIGFQELPCPWSRLDDYALYLGRQKWIRRRFQQPPMDVEMLLWQGSDWEDRLTLVPATAR